jgi:hypothetical protein
MIDYMKIVKQNRKAKSETEAIQARIRVLAWQVDQADYWRRRAEPRRWECNNLARWHQGEARCLDNDVYAQA